VWVAGLTLAAIVYAVGPDRFLAAAFDLSDRIADAIQHALLAFGARAYDLLRALAIASFAIFFALSVIATGRGLPGRWLLFIVTLLFLLLVWHEGPEATGHWMLALVLAVAGAASMTRRLTEIPPPRPLP
jgi:hypothetical protein